MAPIACPRCGRAALAESTPVGVLCRCAACDLEWAETLALDFTTD